MPVVLLMGPTGAGKSSLAIELARRLPIEIVSVDSALVYRGMDIGTAKPDRALRAELPHHLIDIRDPAESYSVGQFLRDAEQLLREIKARGCLALLTGGTMLYFHALLKGLAPLPEGDPELRRELEQRAASEGWAALHAELAGLDPQAASRIHPNDPQRIQRALEVCYLTGAALSDLQSQRQPLLDAAETLQIVLSPAERAVLHRQIEQRLHAMMAAGFLEEVQALHQRGDLHAGTPAIRAVGYRQLWEHLDGVCDLPEAVRRAIVATRRLAKRQLTWLRALPGTEYLNTGNPDTIERLTERFRRLCGPNFS